MDPTVIGQQLTIGSYAALLNRGMQSPERSGPARTPLPTFAFKTTTPDTNGNRLFFQVHIHQIVKAADFLKAVRAHRPSIPVFQVKQTKALKTKKKQ